METTWIDWVVELQAIAQAGLHYSKDIYDIERFQRIREITAQMMSKQSNLPLEVAKDLFCNETGYQTPKLDTRATIFKNDKILLVKEGGKWSLPGGWVDVNESVGSNTIKEVKEETSESNFFAYDELPELDIAKNTAQQICMCFDAYNDKNWVVQFD